MTTILGKHWKESNSELLFINIFKDKSPYYLVQTENSKCLRIREAAYIQSLMLIPGTKECTPDLLTTLTLAFP